MPDDAVLAMFRGRFRRCIAGVNWGLADRRSPVAGPQRPRRLYPWRSRCCVSAPSPRRRPHGALSAAPGLAADSHLRHRRMPRLTSRRPASPGPVPMSASSSAMAGRTHRHHRPHHRAIARRRGWQGRRLWRLQPSVRQQCRCRRRGRPELDDVKGQRRRRICCSVNQQWDLDAARPRRLFVRHAAGLRHRRRCRFRRAGRFRPVLQLGDALGLDARRRRRGGDHAGTSPPASNTSMPITARSSTALASAPPLTSISIRTRCARDLDTSSRAPLSRSIVALPGSTRQRHGGLGATPRLRNCPPLRCLISSPRRVPSRRIGRGEEGDDVGDILDFADAAEHRARRGHPAPPGLLTQSLMSERMMPGSTALTVMPRVPSAFAQAPRHRVQRRLGHAVDDRVREGQVGEAGEMLTIRPPSAMRGASFCVMKNGAFRLIATSASKFSSPASMPAGSERPALLTRMSSRSPSGMPATSASTPSRSPSTARTRSSSRRWRRSHRRAPARPPRCGCNGCRCGRRHGEAERDRLGRCRVRRR